MSSSSSSSRSSRPGITRFRGPRQPAAGNCRAGFEGKDDPLIIWLLKLAVLLSTFSQWSVRTQSESARPMLSVGDALALTEAKSDSLYERIMRVRFPYSTIERQCRICSHRILGELLSAQNLGYHARKLSLATLFSLTNPILALVVRFTWRPWFSAQWNQNCPPVC